MKMAAEAFTTILQAVHDIRSPLSALKVLMTQQRDALPPTQLELVQAVVQRIEQIADDLLHETRDPKAPRTQCLYSALATFLAEKSLQWSGAVLFDYVIDSKLALERIETRELLRVLSNLINNAAEAGARNVRLQVDAVDDDIHILIVDNGIGLPLASLPTFGLGLGSAQDFAAKLGGRLSFHPQATGGTCVQLVLPRNV
jgi:signal transduction histidine kinase